MPKTDVAQGPVDVTVRPLAEIIAQIEMLREEAIDRYDDAIQKLCNKHRVMLATGHISDMWQVKKPRSKVRKDYMDKPVHPIFAELNALDAMVADIGLGPTNMMLFKPNASNERTLLAGGPLD